jgi:hypothetical protein
MARREWGFYAENKFILPVFLAQITLYGEAVAKIEDGVAGFF